ncbi:ubiquinol-cytochrome c reductase subunit 6 [Pseudoscourfieldia marina]
MLVRSNGFVRRRRHPFPISLTPFTNMADEEDPVDTKPELEEQCKPKCAKFLVDYEACVDRIKSDTTGEAHCTGCR